MANNINNTTLEKILDSYVKRGFGSMTKNDFEVWIFHQLLKGKLHGKTNREISIYLRIPDTKVKRLRYEADLKWGKPDDDTTYHDALVDVIKKARLVKNRKQILFVIEDTALLKYLDAKMKTAEVSWDKSFNSENIYIDFDQYELFCKEVLNSEYKEAVDFLQDKFKDKNPIAKFFEEFGKMTCEQILKELSGGAIELTKKSLPLLLSII